ncbi:receptor kinase-like protein Xa21 [Capsicum annuum]|uniref:receptor kinase-like protein Xa21 n=1 Tax=Capsicum annuum TaxID=4072 RepID=UPI001FB0948F|nr:receptor kinase-like protein Xa21 [Capsicum annuum]
MFFIHNEALCGSSRFIVPPCPTSSKHRSNRRNVLVLLLMLGIAVVFVPSTFIFFWIRYRKGKRAPQQADSLSTLRRERISYYELIQATDDLSGSNLIGSGSFGSVYKGVLRSGTAIAVKPSNVLLDEDMVAQLNDFGISKLLGVDDSDLYTKTLATLGYIAPKYGLDGFVSTKCDVYSYGIMLLETFTRRKPNEFEGDLSLKQWVSYALPDAVMDVVDVNLVTPKGNRLQKELDIWASILNVALDCCAESPARRTNMKDVVGMLQKIKIQLLAC